MVDAPYKRISLKKYHCCYGEIFCLGFYKSKGKAVIFLSGKVMV